MSAEFRLIVVLQAAQVQDSSKCLLYCNVNTSDAVKSASAVHKCLNLRGYISGHGQSRHACAVLRGSKDFELCGVYPRLCALVCGHLAMLIA